MLYLMNQHGHYFKVEGKEVDEAKLIQLGCSFFPTLQELYAVVSKKTGIDLDEIQWNECILSWMDNNWIEFAFNGIGNAVELAATEDDIDEDEDILYTNIEDYLANWEC